MPASTASHEIPAKTPIRVSAYPGIPAIVDGSEAIAYVETRIGEVAGAYPITPSTTMALSRMIASGADVKVMVLDTQVYSNTGGQSSTASFGGQVTKLSAFGKAIHGRPEPRKELGRILMAHGAAHVAQTTPAHINHFYRAVMDANTFPGPAVVVVYTPCMPEHGIGDDAATRQAKLAVEARAFPLFTYDPRRGASLRERLSLAGNPALKDDWASAPGGTTIDFLAFARTEGRFAPHFSADGTATSEIQATQLDRLANWRTLQEMAGLLPAEAAAAAPSR